MCAQVGHKIKPNVNIDMFWKSDNTSSFSSTSGMIYIFLIRTCLKAHKEFVSEVIKV